MLSNTSAATPTPNIVPSWWRRDATQNVDRSVIATVNSIQDCEIGIQTRNRRNERLYQINGACYGGMYSSKIGPGPLSTGAGFNQAGPIRNVINSVTNTVVARLIAPGIPDVTFLTTQGDHELQHKAKMLQFFYEGLSYQTELDMHSMSALRDACIFGIGFIKFSSDNDGNMSIQRVHPNEIWTDLLDGRNKKPRCLYHVYVEDRDVLMANFKDKANDLKQIKPFPVTFRTDQTSNSIGVWEAWHLPSAAGASDGKHVICCDGVVLLSEAYEETDFPFAVIRYDPMISGYLSYGLSDLLQGHQTALNHVCKAEYWAHSQISMPRLWLDINSKINRNHANSSRSGLIMEGQGTPPQVLNWTATTPNLVQYKQWIIEDAHEFAGVSMLSAAGKKPAGLDSGAAQREYMDIQSDRFACLSVSWGQFYVDCAKKMINLARHVYTQEGKLSVKVIGKNFIRQIDWKDIDLAEEEYHLQLWATNKLPRTPAGRLQAVTEMSQAGILTPQQATKLLSFQDLDEETSLMNAAEDYADYLADSLLYDGVFLPPDPLTDIATCIRVVTESAIIGLTNKAPTENINLMRRWLAQAQALVAPPMPPAPAPMAPTATPAPSPVSSIMPQTQQ